ncbi:hypothetical protein B0I35DRAFT_427115 [Stachybotrys elegans]|uniref:2EXR domain-containing protein n=1 Tax=Stachybotrys elegans TaxID=80388 RepID=A0A8K0SWT5_9HYPO|nr:hypothetical protein B0I35DRAFT_427115 [Stachybotrys elegans]
MEESASAFSSFNEAYFSKQNPGPTSFELFPMLSAEIRLRIWELSLESTRLLSVEIRKSESENGADEDFPWHKTTNHLGNVISGSPYEWALSHEARPHALFSTCAESRSVAHKHFRVVLPSQQNYKSGRPIRFNPEYDFLMIKIEGYHYYLFVDFLVDCKAYDPKMVGVLNLVMNREGFEKLENIRPPDYPRQALKSLQDTLLNLRHIWAACLMHTEARSMSGPLSGFRNYEIKYNRSLPIFGFAPGFEVLDTDPRPIEPDLGLTNVYDHPRKMKQAWEEFEGRMLGDRDNQMPQRTFSYVLAEYSARNKTIVTDEETMKEYLREEAKFWPDGIEKFYGYPCWVEPEDRKRMLSAAGMWLFPEDTFDKRGGLDLDAPKVVADLGGLKPGLVLCRLDGK